MNIVIIEDERLVAEDLKVSLLQLLNGAAEIVQLRSVKESIAYFENSPNVDLVFSDIQLGDGLSFEIFAKIAPNAPVIFCTAYDQYAMEAFSANGIDYILKPFVSETLARALNKYEQLKQQFTTQNGNSYERLVEILGNRDKKPISSLLVYYQDRIMPIRVNDIAFFYLENEITHIVMFDGKKYYPNKTLEELEKTVGNTFFRANRQFLVSRKVVQDVSSFFGRKLSLNLTVVFEGRITVSKEKTPIFLEWLSSTDA